VRLSSFGETGPVVINDWSVEDESPGGGVNESQSMEKVASPQP
jgi:hypothetical protein